MSTQDDFDSQDTLDDGESFGRTTPAYDNEREKLLCEWRDRWLEIRGFRKWERMERDPPLDAGSVEQQWAAAHIREVIALPDSPFNESGDECEIYLEPKPGCKFEPPNATWKRFADFSDRQRLKIKRGIGAHVGTPLPEIEETKPMYVLDGIIAERDTCLVYGHEKDGKSTWEHKLALVIASENLDFDGMKVKHGRVLYISLDPGARQGQVKRRMIRICARLGIEQPENLILCHDATYLDDPMSVESLLRDNPGEFVLVVIDPLYRALTGGDPAQPGAINAAVESVIRIIEATGAAVMILNHDTKAGGMYGSKFIAAAADCIIFVERDRRTDHVTVTVEETKNTEPPEQPFRYQLEKEYLAPLDAPKARADEPPTVPRLDMLALIPTTWTPTSKARELVKQMLTAKTPAGREKEWERIRERWEAAGLIEQNNRRLRRVPQ